MERVSFDEGIGTQSAPVGEGEVAAGPSLGRISFEEGTGAAQTFSTWDKIQRGVRNLFDTDTTPVPAAGAIPGKKTQQTVGDFLTDSATWKQLGTEAVSTLREGAAIADLGFGFAVLAAKIGVSGAFNFYHSQFVTATPNPLGATAKIIGPAMETPWMKAYAAPLQTLMGAKPEDTLAGRAMEKVGELIDSKAASIVKSTGDPELGEAFKSIVEAGMVALPSVISRVTAKGKGAPAAERPRVDPTLDPEFPSATRPGGAAGQLPPATPYTIDVQGRIIPDAPTVPAPSPIPTLPAPRGSAAAPSPIITSAIANKNAGTTLYVARNGDITTTLGEVVAKRGETSLATYQNLAIVGVASATIWATDPDPEMVALIGVAGATGVSKGKGGSIKLTPPELVKEIAAGGSRKEAALAKVFTDEYSQLVRSLVREHGSLAEDIAMRSFEKFIKNPEAYEGRAAPQTYLQAIAKREATDSWRRAAIRREEPLVLESEVAGRGRDDVSTTKGIEDQSVRGMSPERQLANAQLGQALAERFETMLEAYRGAWEDARVKGKSYQQIADERGVPLETIRVQIYRGNEHMKGGLQEFIQRGGIDAKTLAALGLGAGALAADLSEEQWKQLGMLAGAAGVIKGKGGSWTPATIKRLSSELLSGMGGRVAYRADAPNVLESGGAATVWVDRVIPAHLQKHAGTLTDPLNNIPLPGGRTWGSVMEQLVEPRVKGDLATQGMDLREGEQAWNVAGLHTGGEAAGIFTDYLRHVGEFMQANVDPAKFGQYDLVRAVQETHRADQAITKAAEIARKASGVEELKRMETMPTPMRFPDGARFVQLTKVGDHARESANMGHSISGNEPTAATKGRRDAFEARDLRDQSAHPDWTLEAETGLLKGKSSNGSSTYGPTQRGWEAIKDGSVQNFSLRDNVGMSHATIETVQQRSSYVPDKRNSSRGELTGLYNITQIKGPATPEGGGALIANGPVHTKWQQHLADFLNSREWGSVNLDQSGLLPHKVAMGSVAPFVYKSGTVDFDAISLPPGYYTKETLVKAYAKAGGVIDRSFPHTEAGLKIERDVQGADDGGTPPPRGPGRGEAGGPPPDGPGPFGLASGFGGLDPKHVAAAGLVGAGAAVGAYLSDDEDTLPGILTGSLAGAATALLAFKRKSLDVALGMPITRLKNIYPPIARRVNDMENFSNTSIGDASGKIVGFVKSAKGLSKGAYQQLDAAWMNQDVGMVEGSGTAGA